MVWNKTLSVIAQENVDNFNGPACSTTPETVRAVKNFKKEIDSQTVRASLDRQSKADTFLASKD